MSENKNSESQKSLGQFEKERFTRRQAMRKFGFGAGLSAFMLLGVDDLARMVGQRLQQMDSDNKVANQVAKEFQSAGIALAAGGPSNPCLGKSGSAYTSCCDGLPTTSQCLSCCGDDSNCAVNCTNCEQTPC